MNTDLDTDQEILDEVDVSEISTIDSPNVPLLTLDKANSSKKEVRLHRKCLSLFSILFVCHFIISIVTLIITYIPDLYWNNLDGIIYLKFIITFFIGSGLFCFVFEYFVLFYQKYFCFSSSFKISLSFTFLAVVTRLYIYMIDCEGSFFMRQIVPLFLLSVLSVSNFICFGISLYFSYQFLSGDHRMLYKHFFLNFGESSFIVVSLYLLVMNTLLHFIAMPSGSDFASIFTVILLHVSGLLCQLMSNISGYVHFLIVMYFSPVSWVDCLCGKIEDEEEVPESEVEYGGIVKPIPNTSLSDPLSSDGDSSQKEEMCGGDEEENYSCVRCSAVTLSLFRIFIQTVSVGMYTSSIFVLFFTASYTIWFSFFPFLLCFFVACLNICWIPWVVYLVFQICVGELIKDPEPKNPTPTEEKEERKGEEEAETSKNERLLNAQVIQVDEKVTVLHLPEENEEEYHEEEVGEGLPNALF